MKGLLLLASWFLVAQVTLSQTSTLLPVVQKGKWKLADTSGNIIQETEYDFISLFDNKGTAIVRKNNRYGIITANGKEITPIEYNQIKQLNFGMYAMSEKDGWSIIKPQKSTEALLTNLQTLPTPLSENWVRYQRDSAFHILNLANAKSIKLSDSSRYDWIRGEYLMLDKYGLYTLYNPQGEIVVRDSVVVTLGLNFAFVTLKDKNWFITQFGEYRFPFQVKSIHSNYDQTITVLGDKKASIYSYPKMELVFSGPYTEIYPYDDDFYYVTNLNGTMNYIDRRTKAKKFEDKYVNIYEMGSYFYAEDLNDLSYILDSNQQVVIRGSYSSLFTDGKFIYTQINYMSGLFSCLSKKEILAPIFTRIEITGLTIKASRPKALLALKLDKNHRIIDRMYMENPYDLQTTRPPVSTRPNLDVRLKAMGWYIDSTEREDRDGNIYFTYGIGLRDRNDSIIRKPNLSNLHYLNNDFALFKARSEIVKYHETHQTNIIFKQPFLTHNGKSFMSPIIVGYDSTDFKSKSFMRISFIDKFGILTDTGSVLTYDYIQHEAGTYLVYCKDAIIKPLNASSEETFHVPNMYFNSHQTDYQKPYFGYKPNEHFVFYEKAKWNFLTPTGQPLFKEDFEFAHPFVGSKAITKRKGKWGVVSADTVIIPFIYDQIERVIKDLDTFFICKNNTRGNLVLDSALTAIPGTTNCFSSNGNIGVIEKNNKQILMNSQYQELGDEQNYFKAYPNRFYTYKIKKDFFILDESGSEIGHVKVKTVQFLFNKFAVFESGSKVGLVSLSGDTLLPATYTSFTEIGPYLHAQGFGKSILYDKELKAVFDYESGKLLIDVSTANFAHLDTKKTTVFNQSGKPLAKFKQLNPTGFFNNQLIYTGKESFQINITTKVLDSLNELIEVHQFPNGYVAFRYASKLMELYDTDWQLLMNTDSMVKKINYLGENVFEIRSKKAGDCIYNFENNTRTNILDEVIGTMESKRLLIRKGKQYFYLNDSLKRISNYTYTQAKPFVGNRAAVLDFDGWSLINPDNLLLSYPDFNELTVYSSYFIKAKNRAHYGMYSNSGKVIIPCEYEKLVFVNKKLVQTFLHGEIQYFRTSNGSIIR